MMFDWCARGKHESCPREYKQFYNEKNRVVYTGAVVKCECPKRGCKCYVKRADRAKPKRRVKKK